MNPVYAFCDKCKVGQRIATHGSVRWEWERTSSAHAAFLAAHLKCTEDRPWCIKLGRTLPADVTLNEPKIISGPSGVEEKRRCPKCGSESQNYSTTYMGCLGVPDDNHVQCGECGWEGLAYQMDDAARAARGG